MYIAKIGKILSYVDKYVHIVIHLCVFLQWSFNLLGLSNAKSNARWEDKEVHTGPQGICPKVNIIAGEVFEHAYYDYAVQRHNITPRGPLGVCVCIWEKLSKSI